MWMKVEEISRLPEKGKSNLFYTYNNQFSLEQIYLT